MDRFVVEFIAKILIVNRIATYSADRYYTASIYAMNAGRASIRLTSRRIAFFLPMLPERVDDVLIKTASEAKGCHKTTANKQQICKIVHHLISTPQKIV